MKLQVLTLLVVVGTCLCRPSNDIIDIETDHLEHEQEGEAGKAVEGHYSWVAPNGKEIKVEYVADHNGFRVLDSENIHPEVDAALTKSADAIEEGPAEEEEAAVEEEEGAEEEEGEDEEEEVEEDEEEEEEDDD